MEILRVLDTISQEIEDTWATPSKLRPLFYDDPAIVWLEQHGAAHGFMPDRPQYSLMEKLEQKGKQFEAAWMQRYAPEAVYICEHAGEARQPARVHQTIEHMRQGIAVIAQPALHWAAEQIYGAPDLIVRADWFRQTFPNLSHLDNPDETYLVIDIKFTSKLTSPEKKNDHRYYSAQVRLYSYMLGQIQGFMPQQAFLSTRDTLDNPLGIAIQSSVGQPLDADLRAYCERYRSIIERGMEQRPWIDPDLTPNYSHSNERWNTAKKSIMARVPDGELTQLWYLGQSARQQLYSAGITSLIQLQNTDPAQLPKGTLRRREPMLAILEANRSGQAKRNHAATPPPRPHEFFVDCEFFSSINVDFEREWPELRGTPMIFMIGVGWIEGSDWHYCDFIAAEETQQAERVILETFLSFLEEQSNREDFALYHWSHAERTQTSSAADRHGLPTNHQLRNLPWDDLEQRLTKHGCAIPGAWNYSLKPFVRALANLDSSFADEWPEDLSDGSMAQAMGWSAYQCPNPLTSSEMELLRTYLAADCRALMHVLRWLRG